MNAQFFAITSGILMITSISVSIPEAFATDNRDMNDQNQSPSILYIDRMDGEEVMANGLGGRNSVYIKPPSSAFFSKSQDYGKGNDNFGLKIGYTKKNEGGQYQDGGWCGFYTILHKNKNDYLDVSKYNHLIFWVKGQKGKEDFKIGASDELLEARQYSVKSAPISNYLPSEEITTEWQLAVIPMDDFFLDWKRLHALTISFDSDVFDNAKGEGTIYIDDLAFIKADDPVMAVQNITDSNDPITEDIELEGLN